MVARGREKEGMGREPEEGGESKGAGGREGRGGRRREGDQEKRSSWRSVVAGAPEDEVRAQWAQLHTWMDGRGMKGVEKEVRGALMVRKTWREGGREETAQGEGSNRSQWREVGGAGCEFRSWVQENQPCNVA